MVAQCSVEWNRLCNFGRKHLRNNFEFGLVVQEEMSFKDISYLELWRPLFLRSGTICAILVEGIMRNNSVKLF